MLFTRLHNVLWSVSARTPSPDSPGVTRCMSASDAPRCRSTLSLCRSDQRVRAVMSQSYVSPRLGMCDGRNGCMTMTNTTGGFRSVTVRDFKYNLSSLALLLCARACTTATGGLVFFIAADVLIPKAVIFVLIESKRPVPGLYSYTDVINGSYWGHRSCAQWRFISHALSCDGTDVPNNYMYTLYTLETFVPPLIHSLLLQKWKLQVQISDYLLLWGHICFKFQSLVCIYFA